jgi:hypothetical protein
MTTLREAEPEEPCFCDRNGIGEPGVSCGDCPTRDYKNTPPHREWQGLTDEEIWSDGSRMGLSEGGIRRFAREIEAKLKEKNT